MRKEKEKPFCPVCGKETKENELYSCNFETMAGRAGWNLTFYPKMKMCHECSNNLLNYIERWFKVSDKTGYFKKEYKK